MNHKQSPEKRRQKENVIIDQAKQLFLEKGIREVSMEDIAKKAQIGVASLYRYFRMKKVLVLACGTRIWEERQEEFDRIFKQDEALSKTGIDTVHDLLYYYLDLFDNNKEFFIFIHLLDTYCMIDRFSKEEMSEYNNALLSIYRIFQRAMEKGLGDHTIRPELDYPTTYFAFSKALLGLAQKLILENNIVPSDDRFSSRDQIKTLLDVLFQHFKA